MKVSIPGFVYARPASACESGVEVVDGHCMHFFACDGMQDYGYVKVTPTVLTFEMPDGWDPRAQQIEALNAKKREITAEFNKRVTEINAQINNLLAIEQVSA